jgi:CRP-like cAMP-binding protein
MKEFLKEVSLFSELNDEELDLLARAAHEKVYPKNSFIVRKGEAGTSLFLIRSGEVKIVLEKTKGGEVPLTTLGKGSFFGEDSLFNDRPRSATVVAQEDTSIVEIRREDFLKKLTKSSEIASKVIAEMSNKLICTEEALKEIADKVYNGERTNLEENLRTQLESAKTIFQKTEERASKTIEHVERSWSTLTRIVTIILIAISVVGSALGYFGYTTLTETIKTQKDALVKQNEANEIIEEAVNQQKVLNQLQENIRGLLGNLFIEKIREDINLDETIDEMDTVTLRKVAINFRRSKQQLLEYIDIENQDDYGPEVKLEAVQTFLKLISRSGEELDFEDKYSIFTILKTILTTNREEGDWRMRMIAREELINLGRKDSEFAEKYIREELQGIILNEKMEDNVKSDMARVLATIGKADNNTKEVLMKMMKKKGDIKLDRRAKRRADDNARVAAVTLIQMGDNEGREYIIETIKKGGKPGFRAALDLGHLLSNKTPEELGWEEDIDPVLMVIDRINEEIDSSDFNKYMRIYAEEIVDDIRTVRGISGE